MRTPALRLSASVSGGSEAFHSNAALAECLRAGCVKAGLPENSIVVPPTTDRAAVNALLQLDTLIDVVIPRGGESLIRAVAVTTSPTPTCFKFSSSRR